MTAPRLYGLLAEFATADDLIAAAKRVRAAGYRRVEAYTPFDVEGLAEALGFEKSSVPFFTFCGALLGGAGGFFMQWYAAAIDYPIDVAGRPLNSWPMFMPVTFELAVLGGAIAAVLAMLLASGLPRLRHPIADAPDFELATRNRFFLCLRGDEAGFDRDAAERLLDELKPLRRAEVLR